MAGQSLCIQAHAALEEMRIEEALRLFQQAEQAGCDPDVCSAGRWTCYMLLGDFESAWQQSDAIATRGNPDPHRFWDRQPFAGRHVLIRCLHGLGDTIHFIRYAPLIREQARSVTIEAQPTLKALLAQAGIADAVITWGDPEPYWDQQMEVIELPRVFRTTLASIPSRVPYLSAAGVRDIQGHGSETGLRVGLVWGSSAYNPQRSIELTQLAQIFDISGVSFFSLQAGPQRAELAAWSSQIPDLYDESGCVLPMAQALNSLDLVITVDTMMAHLAGATGRPVWTLLPFESDWRWMLKREDSPWYPTMRLFRQEQRGDWSPVVARLSRALRSIHDQGFVDGANQRVLAT